jgi:hypothetical protein
MLQNHVLLLLQFIIFWGRTYCLYKDSVLNLLNIILFSVTNVLATNDEFNIHTIFSILIS